MKVNVLDAHDRLQHFTKQSFDIGKSCQNLIDQRPFGDHPFYIFAHTRTLGLDEKQSLLMEDLSLSLQNLAYVRKYKTLADVPEKRLIWQPRLTKPKAQSNSMLFKGYPGTDLIKTIWILPAPELWEQYEKGKLTQNETISESIYRYKNNRKAMEEKEEDDLDDASIDAIYRQISQSANPQKFQMISS